MQDWDRWVMVLVGLLVSAYAARDGWRLWKKRKYLAVTGIGILILGAVGVPALLALYAT